MRKFDLSLRSSRSSYFATFRHQLTILSKTDALDEEKWLNMLGTFVKDWYIRVSLGTVRHPRRFKIVVIDIQITLKQMLRDFIGIRVNRAKKSGMVNITSSVNSRERSGINTILHELNPLFTINVTMRDIKSKNVYSR